MISFQTTRIFISACIRAILHSVNERFIRHPSYVSYISNSFLPRTVILQKKESIRYFFYETTHFEKIIISSRIFSTRQTNIRGKENRIWTRFPNCNEFALSSSLQEFLPVLSHPVEIIRDRSDLAIRKPRLNLRFRGQLNSFALCTRVHRLSGTKFPKPDLCNLLSIPPPFRFRFISFFNILFDLFVYF